MQLGVGKKRAICHQTVILAPIFLRNSAKLPAILMKLSNQIALMKLKV